MTKKKVVIAILLFMASTIFGFSLAMLGTFNNDIKLLGGVTAYFLVAYLTQKIKLIISQKISFIILISPIFIFQLSSNVLSYQQTIGSLPIHIFLLFSAFTGYFFARVSKLVLPLFLLTLGTYFFYGQEHYFNFRYYGNSEKVPYAPLLFNGLKNHLNNDFQVSRTKITIIDFWNSKCASCYRIFPYIDSINRNVDTNKYEILVLNIPTNGEQRKNNLSLLRPYGYSFKQIFATDSKIMDSLNLNMFPTTIVLEDGKVNYYGNFKDAVRKYQL